MLISFEKFNELYSKDKARINCTLHYLELNDSFTMIFLSKEGIYYSTKVTKQSIIDFANQYEIPEEKALSDFKLEYLRDSVEYFEEPTGDYSEQNLVPNYKSFNELMTKSIIDAGMDVVDEATDYADFIVKSFDRMEKVVLDAIKYLDLADTNKTFGQFLGTITNIINTKSFLFKIRKYIKAGMDKGVESAQDELNVKVSIGVNFDTALKTFEGQQFNGYTIHGKKWHGIKGATADLQQKILKLVDESMQNQSSKSELADKIKELFSGSTVSQAKKIARTETNRFINEGKLYTYKESGLEGRKAWSVVPIKCCEICQRMHDAYFDKGIGFDEPFIDPLTNKAYQYPPAHPHCMCVIEFRPIGEN